jgi:3-phenylpropionate/trans-cinnamate dioxygenase ferredoxin subunit
MNWIKIMPSNKIINDDFITKFNVIGKNICLVRTEGELFAVQNICPHAGAQLSNGWCSQGKIICPYHRHEFNLQTGRGSVGQANYINTYPLEIREDGLYIGIKKPWWRFWW